MAYLPLIYESQIIDTTLEDTITALGLVGLGNTKGSSQALMAAHAKYAKALSAINSKLQKPKDAVSDQVLVTVLLLGVYEVSSHQSHLLGRTDIW